MNATAAQSKGRDKLPNDLRLIFFILAGVYDRPSSMSCPAPGKGHVCAFNGSFVPQRINYWEKLTYVITLGLLEEPPRNHNILSQSMMLRFYQNKGIKYSLNITFKLA